jgi:integrase/recombinase XerD
VVPEPTPTRTPTDTPTTGVHPPFEGGVRFRLPPQRREDSKDQSATMNVPDPDVTSKLLDIWTTHMRAEGRGEHTIKDRRSFILATEARIGKPILEATRNDLIGVMAEIAKNLKPSSRRNRRSIFRTFFGWLQDEGYRLDDPSHRLPRVHVPRRDVNPVHIDDIARTVNSGAYKRTRMMVALHYYVGLRIHEIAKIRGEDIDWNNGILTVTGKGGYHARLGIPAALWELIQPMPHTGYWFPNYRANRLFAAGEGHIMTKSVSDAIHDAFARAGVKGHRPHDLRASTATEQKRAGVHGESSRQSMRHAKIDTTSHYWSSDVEETRAAFDAQPVIPFPDQSRRKRAA